MADYTRRPFLMGNTDIPVLSQPELRSSVSKDASGEIAGLPLPADLTLETEDGATTGGLSVTLTSSRTLAHIIDRINTVMSGYATAEEFEGALVIRSEGAGEGSFIRVRPAGSGFSDAAPHLGFEVFPHPLATVKAGDLQDAPVRPDQQNNPIGTKMVATGEDRVGSAYNRILSRFGINQDTLYTWLKKPIARMVVVEVDETTHAAQIATNADGTIDQINLSDLSVFDSDLAGQRLYVGKLSANSKLTDIAEFWGALDSNHNELTAGDRTVRIGPVTRGQRGPSKPTYADDFSAPSSVLGDTTGTAPDGLNALGVDRQKSSETITDIRSRTTITCTGATFETDGVVAGDKAVISGASVNTPFNHNGTYIVDTVVDEETLVLRPSHVSGNVQELNPASGTFGTVVISSGGEWESNLWVTFEPSLPRMPEDGKLLLVLPVEVSLADLKVGDLVAGDVRSAEEVDGWVKKELWKEKGIGGTYQGQASARGSGFWGRITHRPLTLASSRAESLTPLGSSARTSTAAASMDYATRRLTAGAADRFLESDVGKTILLTDTTNLPAEEHPWTIVKLIDASTVELAPPPESTGLGEGASLTGTVSVWDIREGDQHHPPAVLQMIVPDEFGVPATPTSTARLGLLYLREYRDDSTDDTEQGLLSFAHLEKVKLRYDTPSAVNMTTVTASAIATDTITLPFDPESTGNIRPEVAEQYTADRQGGTSFVRVLHGANQGIYRVYETQSSAGGGSNAVVVRNLDGSTPAFTSESDIEVCFYTAYVAVAQPIQGGSGSATATHQAAINVFGDAVNSDVEKAIGVRVGWRGDGVGFQAVVGDPEFHAFSRGDHAQGKLADFRVFGPVTGVDVAAIGDSSGADAKRGSYGFKVKTFTHLHDLSIEAVTAAGFDFTSYAGLIHQGGTDPGAVVVKTEDSTDEAEPSFEYSRLSASAAMLLGRASASLGSADVSTAVAGRGSALEQRGSTYVYRGSLVETDNGQAGWADGGIYVEDVLGTGWWAYPIAATYGQASDFPWQGTSAFADWATGTSLGYPGRVWPRRATLGTPPDGTLSEPDYSVFKMPHAGILEISNNDPGGEAIPRPFNRLVGCRVRIEEAGHALEGEELVIQAVKRVGNSATTCQLALYYTEDHTTVITAGQAGTAAYVILGQRYWESYLNVGDYFLVGTGLRSAWGLSGLDANLQHDSVLPLTTALEDEPNDLNTGRVASRGASLEGMGLISDTYWSSATEGVRLGTMDALSSMTNVDVTPAAFASAVSWVGDAQDGAHVEHGWAEDVRSPRSPFPNHAVFARPDPATSADDILDQDYLGNLLVDDYAITLPGSPVSPDVIFRWSEEYGGCLFLTESSLAADQDVRIWQRGHTLALQGHLAVRVRLILQWSSDYGDGTVALRTVDGAVLESQTLTLAASHPGTDTPVEFEIEFTVEDSEALHAGGPGSIAATRLLQQLCVTIDVTMPGGATSTDFRILEWQTEHITRPQVLSGPQAVAGTVSAHGFRLLDPAPGYDTRGPQDAWWLSNMEYASHFSHDRDPFLSDSGYTPLSFAAGIQEKHHRPGRLNIDQSGWVEPYVDYFRWWGQGPHSASITMWSGAFDPVYYAFLACSEELPGGSAASDTLHLDQFVTPGMTGFGVPFDPPHGSLLKSLALSLSFTPSIVASANPGNKHWGVFRGYFGGVATSAASGDPSLTELLRKSNWDTAQGVWVYVWRQSILDTGIENGEFAEFSAFLPEHGYAEKIARFEISLDNFDVDADYDYDTNPITAATVGGNTYFAGRELFVRRNFNVWEQVASGDEQLLQVDRRNYTYFVTVEWWGGPRLAGPFGSGNDNIYYYPTGTPTFSDFPESVSGAPAFGSALGRYVYALDHNYVSASSFNRPPQVKFRGARLGYLTDRAGHGGWGS